MPQTGLLPPPDLLRRLAVNESGFLFDPVSGRSFTVNESGLALLRLMRQGLPLPEIVTRVTGEWAVEPRQVERDLLEFAAALRKALPA